MAGGAIIKHRKQNEVKIFFYGGENLINKSSGFFLKMVSIVLKNDHRSNY